MQGRFKYLLLALGACLIIASSMTETSLMTAEAGKDTTPPGSKDFMPPGEDEFIKPVEDYTAEEPGREPGCTAPPGGDNTLYITIPKGAKGSDVAALLFERGLIEDKGEFETYLVEHKLDRRIIYGIYNLKKCKDVQTIIKIITGGSQ